jgi:predicted glycosyltransferase
MKIEAGNSWTSDSAHNRLDLLDKEASSTKAFVADECHAVDSTVMPKRRHSRKKIWIDMDNSPHVPFFLPILDELRARGYELLVTARNSYQVCELLNLYNLRCRVIGRHWGKNRALKILGTLFRTIRLLPVALRSRPHLAVSHGSRAQLLVGHVLKIPTLLIYDYEYTQKMGFLRSPWFMTPEYVPSPEDPHMRARLLKYPGLKEDVYVPRFRPDPTLREQLGIPADKTVVTVRPPATEAHYHNPESEALLEAAMDLFMERPEVRVVLLPRSERQEASLRETWGEWIARKKIIIPKHAVDGLNLVWSSDLVVSGGGTMNREAAALGVPVYSIFRGKIGAVDHFLAEHGRLRLIETVEDVRTKIVLAPRDHSVPPQTDKLPTLQIIVENIVSVLELTDKQRFTPLIGLLA